jgi:hypothetical protein
MMTKVYHVGDLVHQTTGQTWEMAAEMLVRHVQLVEPHSWNSGGAVCGCYAPTETITVRQSLEAHEQIERMLNDMRLHGRKAMYGSTRPSSTVGKP